MYGIDEGIRNATETKTPCEECGVGAHVRNGSGGGREHFVDFMTAGGGGEFPKSTGLCLKTCKCSDRVGVSIHLPF